jgi:hypothetical protein
MAGVGTTFNGRKQWTTDGRLRILNEASKKWPNADSGEFDQPFLRGSSAMQNKNSISDGLLPQILKRVRLIKQVFEPNTKASYSLSRECNSIGRG